MAWMLRSLSVFCTGSAKVRLFLLSTPDFNTRSKLYLKRKFYFHTRKKKFIFYHGLQQDTRKNHVSCSKCRIVNVNIYRFLFSVFAVWVLKWWSVTYMCCCFLAVWLKFAFVLIQNLYRSPFKNNCSELFLWVGTHGEIFKKKLSVVLFPISKTISGKVSRV